MTDLDVVGMLQYSREVSHGLICYYLNLISYKTFCRRQIVSIELTSITFHRVKDNNFSYKIILFIEPTYLFLNS